MKVGFVLPSCNYNIVLTEEELKQLNETAHCLMMKPGKTYGTFRDGMNKEAVAEHGHYLTYSGHEEWSVQFLTISAESQVGKERKNIYCDYQNADWVTRFTDVYSTSYYTTMIYKHVFYILKRGQLTYVDVKLDLRFTKESTLIEIMECYGITPKELKNEKDM